MAYRPRFSIAKLLSTEALPGICKLGESGDESTQAYSLKA
jgi:hypothetical protein